jgi:hypothetical protein
VVEGVVNSGRKNRHSLKDLAKLARCSCCCRCISPFFIPQNVVYIPYHAVSVSVITYYFALALQNLEAGRHTYIIRNSEFIIGILPHILQFRYLQSSYPTLLIPPDNGIVFFLFISCNISILFLFLFFVLLLSSCFLCSSVVFYTLSFPLFSTAIYRQQRSMVVMVAVDVVQHGDESDEISKSVRVFNCGRWIC